MMIRRLLIGSMSTIRQLHVISRSKTNTIKPASPTPSESKQYNFSPIGMAFNMHMPMLLCYPTNNFTETTISDRLKSSLSQTLTKYYPFAGRLASRSHIDCRDQGVEFVEARIGCKLSEILNKAPENSSEQGLSQLFPPRSLWARADQNSSLLVVQLNHFDCGGIAIAVTMSHIIADACTFCSFLNYWATLSRNSADLRPPHFVDKLCPQLNSYNDSIIMAVDAARLEKYWMTKEFVFHNSKIAELKAVVAIQNQQQGVKNENPTRVEALTALLYKCAVAATARSNSGSFTPSVLFQVVNMRPMMVPPMHETTVGNICCMNCIPTRIESETNLGSLVVQIKNEKMKVKEIRTLDGLENDFRSKVIEYTTNNYKIYVISSMCNFPLHDHVDFGWGKPVKATIVDTSEANIIVLMDTPTGDGIKAIVSLEEQDMEMFQGDKELLTYASL